MWLLYVLALVLAGGLLLAQALGGDHHLGGLGGHLDVDGPHPMGWLSARGVVFGLFGFGLVGVGLHAFALAAPPLVLAAAVGSGIASALVAGLAFRALDQQIASGSTGLNDAIGLTGRVLVPVAPGQRGKIRVQLKGHVVDMLALSDEGPLDAGAEILVVDVDDDVAHVVTSTFGNPILPEV